MRRIEALLLAVLGLVSTTLLVVLSLGVVRVATDEGAPPTRPRVDPRADVGEGWTIVEARPGSAPPATTAGSKVLENGPRTPPTWELPTLRRRAGFDLFEIQLEDPRRAVEELGRFDPGAPANLAAVRTESHCGLNVPVSWGHRGVLVQLRREPTRGTEAEELALRVEVPTRASPEDVLRVELEGLVLEPGAWSARVDGIDCQMLTAGLLSAQFEIVVPSERRAGSIRVHAVRSGCTGSFEQWVLLNPSAEAYASHDGHLVPRATVEVLRDAILDARPPRGEGRRPSTEDLAVLGVTEAALEAHLDEIAQTILCRDWQDDEGFPPDLGAELSACLSTGRLLSSVAGSFGPTSTTEIRFSFFLPGEPWIWVLAATDVPGKLPLHVFVEGQDWLIFDPRVATLLADLVPDGWPCDQLFPVGSEALRDAQAYWPDGIWTDARVWASVHEQAAAQLGLRRLRLLDGYDDAVRRFDLVELQTFPGLERRVPRSASVFGREPALVDVLSWSTPAEETHERAGWKDLLEAYDRVATAAARHGWLQAWKDADTGRRIHLSVRPGPSCLAIEGPLGQAVLAAWSHAGLPGEPDASLQLELRLGHVGATRSHMRSMTVALAAGVDALLVVDSIAAGGLPAPDGTSNWSVTRSGTYAAIRGGAAPEFRTLPDVSR